MTSLISLILKDNTYQFIIRCALFIEMLLYLTLFVKKYNRKKNFIGKFILFVLMGFILIIPLSVLRTKYNAILLSIFTTYAIISYLFVMLINLFDEEHSALLLSLCGSVALQIIIGRIYEFLFILNHKNPYSDLLPFNIYPEIASIGWIIYFSIHFIIAFLLSYYFVKIDVRHHDTKNSKKIIYFSIFITLITIPINNYSRTLEGNNLSIDYLIRIISILYAFLVLFLRMNLLESSKVSTELTVLDEVLKSERKQYDSIRNDMELINIKNHDIMQHLTRIESKITSEELLNIKNSIQFTDKSIASGCEILDVILFKKQLYSEKNNINVTCIADGQLLKFMKTTHLYSLLSNAIENAFEAVIKVDDIDKRFVSIVIKLDHGLVSISVCNYYNNKTIQFLGDLTTTKENSHEHGYGFKSMKYIVSLYDGKLSYHTQDDQFFLNIYFPIDLSLPPEH